jgi:hypothetical protein
LSQKDLEQENRDANGSKGPTPEPGKVKSKT